MISIICESQQIILQHILPFPLYKSQMFVSRVFFAYFCVSVYLNLHKEIQCHGSSIKFYDFYTILMVQE
jgi:hypothetical protein